MSQRQTVRRKDSSPDSDAKPLLVVNGKQNRDPRFNLAEQISGTQYYIRNWKWSGAVEDFPNEPWMRCVDKFFPRAGVGPLAIDEPVMESEMVACERKAKALKKRGIRYLVLKEGMTLQQCQVALDLQEDKA